MLVRLHITYVSPIAQNVCKADYTKHV